MFEESVLGLPKQTQKFVYKNVDWELFVKQFKCNLLLVKQDSR